MELQPLYTIQVHCLQCEEPFMTSRVRPSFKRAVRTDADFCRYYAKDNPDFYVVRVCPFCGFAFTENFEERLNDNQRSTFRNQLGGRLALRDFGGERLWQNALETYQLGLLCAQTIGEKERIIASMLHHIAWLYRYKDQSEQEQRFLTYSLDAYILVYEKEGVGANDAKLMYFIGELSRRLGKYNDAVRWFSRVINDTKIMDAAMIRQSREQWSVLREDMQAAKLAVPDELKIEPK
ncbi:uncharacterized protein (DUF2225 family) [Paenibacillus shirakamiensis]|uniref:Uncharacterized protein (DUF2225 family) n=1 Tax=Paenibacillus shirakamiensis TaxID=1265935 RepID=A0ABS4JK05_9BACL|nr:DUF2225 domain-containing protein [Paenibacillus shirakamiensis]MBP2002043.1 uncharacterized protein (DUF2225 family) [Paenibacillus shirakamiensis]